MDKCARRASREARKRLESHVLSPIERWKLDVASPHACAWHPQRDYLADHEMVKSRVHSQEWHCKLCGKRFRSEHFLDLHLDRRHSHELPQPSDTPDAVCLADFCDILRCPSWVEVAHRTDPMACSHAELRERRAHCRETLRGCLPADSSNASALLYERLDQDLCKPLSCEWRAAAQHNAARTGSLDAWSLPAAALPGGAGPVTSAFNFFAASLVGGILCFYLCLFHWQREEARTGGKRRLRPVANRPNRSWLPTARHRAMD